MSIANQDVPPVGVVCGPEWISIAALLIALGALAVSIVTSYLRDAYRGNLRLWFPNPDGNLPQDTLDPYLDIVNKSPFDIRVIALYAETRDGTPFYLPGPWGRNDTFPKEIGARRSERIGLHFTSFFGLVGKKFKLIAETDTGKRFYPKLGHMKGVKRYIETVVAEQEQLANDEKRKIIREYSPNFRAPE